MTRQGKHAREYPLIPVSAYVKEAVKAWAKENKYKMYKVGELIEKLPELQPYIEANK